MREKKKLKPNFSYLFIKKLTKIIKFQKIPFLQKINFIIIIKKIQQKIIERKEGSLKQGKRKWYKRNALN